ncbi:hypothetical protein BU16DRAFT_526427 [Lophium mytilinum]|uniref:Transcriptional regulatory protein RXT2 N-terminal domain-containing protein n=1 Tax=Lophium mytilinum TaxID=390894 RepID=A0A6A6QXT8_9PEZI|nr:hypothetical protein BU16DRAFT_526427 [Lophium mytilinum]
MAGQQQHIIDTIFSMKKRILRRDDSSDSDEAETPFDSRMYSLKRKAAASHSGKPDFDAEAPPYKKRIEHAGYHRYILHRNPPRFDPDGDIVEYGDEYEDEEDLTTIEENPYADIHLEHILAPLTSAAELQNHPSMSIPYTSKHLTHLTEEAGAISRRELASQWRAKNLLSKLQGDNTWVPCGLMETGTDKFVLGGLQTNGTASATTPPSRNNSLTELQHSWGNGTTAEASMDPAGLRTPPPTSAPRQVPLLDVQMVDIEVAHGSRADVITGHVQTTGSAPQAHPGSTLQNGTNGHLPDPSQLHNGTDADTAQPTTNGTTHDGDHDQENESNLPSPPADDASDTTSQPTSHRMTTRARAHVSKSPSPPPSPPDTLNPIHPMYKFPMDIIPDRDYGLPATEAEDTRMMLLAVVQKMEQIANRSTDLYMGMLQAERMRQDVFKWSKAEAHVGEMSDGEDWYDREEWGLEEDLVKGRDEEEEEGAAAAGKKSTRQRGGRRADKEDR